MQPTEDLVTTAKSIKTYFYLFVENKNNTRQRSVAYHAIENYNLSLKLVTVIQFLECDLFEFRFEGGILFPIILEYGYKNKFALRFFHYTEIKNFREVPQEKR